MLLGTARELTVLVDRGSFSAEMNTTHTHTLSLSLYPAVYLFIQVLLESCASLYYKIGLGQIYWSIYDTAYYVTFGKKGDGAREIESRSFESKMI